MKVEITNISEVSILSPQGELDLSNSKTLEKVIGKQIEKGCNEIIIDFGGVPFVDTAGIGALITSLICLRDKKGNLKLSSLEPQVKKTLQMAGLTKIFKIYKNREEAVRSVQLRT